MYAFKETYESAYNIPVPIRKWLIERYNKQKKEEQKTRNQDQPDVNQPLSPRDKEKLKRNSK